MKKRSIILIVAALVFLLLFAGKFFVDLRRNAGQWQRPQFQENYNNANLDQIVQASSDGISQARKNYASAKMNIPQAGMGTQVVEQKYERVSTMSASSANWSKDTESLQTIIRESKALVQSEDSTGLEGTRRLSLELGVVPDAFDPTVERLRGVGKLESIVVTKTDRTADFRALEARRLSLEKTRDGLAALRNSGAELKDRIDLESRILEIEGQIQELGVSLGDFNENNSFCTIRITLYEDRASTAGSRILPALVSALSWTVPVYLGIALSILAVLGIAALGLKLWDMIRNSLREAAEKKQRTVVEKQ